MMKLKQLWHNWNEIAVHIGDFQARWLLTVFYFIILLPAGLILSLGGDPLQIHCKPKQSGWIKRKTTDVTLKQGRRQY